MWRKEEKKKESNFNGWKEWRRSKCGKSFWCLMWQHKAMGPTDSIKLPNCHVTHKSSIWKHLKLVSNFHNLLLTLVRIEWWKQNLKTHPNKLLLLRTHHFWVMGDENTKIQTAPKFACLRWLSESSNTYKLAWSCSRLTKTRVVYLIFPIMSVRF